MENETNETKQNWLKTHAKTCIICLIVITAIAAVVVVFMMNQKDSPEKIMEAYINAMSNGDVDAIMNITDLKGTAAWENCDNNPEKFLEEYKTVSDEDVSSHESEARESLESGIAMLKSFGGLEISVNSIGTPEKLANDLYKIKASIKIKISVLGMDQEQDQDLTIVTYNGKYIGEYSEEE